MPGRVFAFPRDRLAPDEEPGPHDIMNHSPFGRRVASRTTRFSSRSIRGSHPSRTSRRLSTDVERSGTQRRRQFGLPGFFPVRQRFLHVGVMVFFLSGPVVHETGGLHHGARSRSGSRFAGFLPPSLPRRVPAIRRSPCIRLRANWVWEAAGCAPGPSHCNLGHGAVRLAGSAIVTRTCLGPAFALRPC